MFESFKGFTLGHGVLNLYIANSDYRKTWHNAEPGLSACLGSVLLAVEWVYPDIPEIDS